MFFCPFLVRDPTRHSRAWLPKLPRPPRIYKSWLPRPPFEVSNAYSDSALDLHRSFAPVLGCESLVREVRRGTWTSDPGLERNLPSPPSLIMEVRRSARTSDPGLGRNGPSPPSLITGVRGGAWTSDLGLGRNLPRPLSLLTGLGRRLPSPPSLTTAVRGPLILDWGEASPVHLL